MAASGAGNNPVYQSMQLELNKVDVEIAALRRELAQHQSTVADLRQRLNSAPQVEAEYQQLNRDYDVNKAQYTALLESYQKARLGRAGGQRRIGALRGGAAADSTGGAGVAQAHMLLAGIWLAALAVGAALAYGLHLLKPIVISVRAMNELTSFPVSGCGRYRVSLPSAGASAAPHVAYFRGCRLLGGGLRRRAGIEPVGSAAHDSLRSSPW